MDLRILILAAGKGTRMRSSLPKVLHPLAGRSLLRHVHAVARALAPRELAVVYGYGGEQVRADVDDAGLRWVHQAEQRGTGHAVDTALQAMSPPASSIVLVLYGDVPMIALRTLQPLIEQAAGGALAVLSVELDAPTGYGRVVRGDDGAVLRVVEENDASDAERALREVNTGILAMRAGPLTELLRHVDCDNAQGEYYLTDIVALAVAAGVPVQATRAGDRNEVLGVNSRAQLAALERLYQARTAARLMGQGATLADPARIDVRGELTVGEDVFIDVGCVFEGTTRLGDRVQVGPYCVIRDTTLADDAQVLGHSVLEHADIGARCLLGPFARLRPGSHLAEGAKVGNFVEMKNALIGRGSKVNHLSYVGDSELGARVNVGAGTITCNYDGANKNRTLIGDDVFVGSNCSLVAPVQVGNGATIGAGSTISRDVAAGDLALTRTKQRAVPGWQRPRKHKG